MFEKILNNLSKKRISAILITNLINVRYLTGFTGSNGQVLITKNNFYFFSDFRYMEQAEKEVNKIFKIVIYKNFYKELKRIIIKEKIKNLAVEGTIKLEEFNYINKKLNFLKIKVLKNFIENFRRKKNKNEVKYIKQAIKITEKALKNISYYFDLKNFNITEKNLALKIYQEMIKSGAEDIAFPIIVLSGKNTSLIHGKPSNIEIKNNILIDTGCKFKGFCSDKTITVLLNKESEIKKIFTIVKDAKNFALEKIKPGIKASSIDKTAREFILNKGYGKFFAHSLGHGVGMEVHELPLISSQSKDIIDEGDIFTIEPGIYIPDFGGVRLEDMVYVTENGIELLTDLAENFNI